MFIGRDSEIAQLEKVLREGKQALVVISSKPGMGRPELLEELRSRAKNLNWRILPVVLKEEELPGTIAINRNTTTKDFREKVSLTPFIDIKADDSRIQTTTPYQSSAVPESAKDETGKKAESVFSVQRTQTEFQQQDIKQDAPQECAKEKPSPTTEVGQVLGGTLILIDGYQPNKEFETWFLQDYLHEIKRVMFPIVIVVAGYSGDLAALTKFADRIVELDELQIQTTTDYFRDLNNHIEVKMEEKEIQAYAVESAKDPSLIDALTRLLPLR
jgi:hypothetical protein